MKGQTFENHNEAGDWMCYECWVNEALAGCLKVVADVQQIQDAADADKLVDDVYA